MKIMIMEYEDMKENKYMNMDMNEIMWKDKIWNNENNMEERIIINNEGE